MSTPPQLRYLLPKPWVAQQGLLSHVLLRQHGKVHVLTPFLNPQECIGGFARFVAYVARERNGKSPVAKFPQSLHGVYGT